jgi:hypothetical protein
MLQHLVWSMADVSEYFTAYVIRVITLRSVMPLGAQLNIHQTKQT